MSQDKEAVASLSSLGGEALARFLIGVTLNFGVTLNWCNFKFVCYFKFWGDLKFWCNFKLV